MVEPFICGKNAKIAVAGAFENRSDIVDARVCAVQAEPGAGQIRYGLVFLGKGLQRVKAEDCRT